MYDIAVNTRPSALDKGGSGQSKTIYYSSTDNGEVYFGPASSFDVHREFFWWIVDVQLDTELKAISPW